MIIGLLVWGFDRSTLNKVGKVTIVTPVGGIFSLSDQICV
jgi:hypothetical protein